MELQTLSKEEFAWKYAISAVKEIRDE